LNKSQNGSIKTKGTSKDEPVQKTLAETLNMEKKEDYFGDTHPSDSVSEVLSTQKPQAMQGNGSVEHIRMNNIRKSSGDFNRHQDNDSKVDYLAGVQSEVLKSLIKRLRED
jgi:hypothetical protein